MMRKLSILFMSFGLVGGLSSSASALPLVFNTVTPLSGGGFQYTYKLDNSLGTESIFDFGLYYFGPVEDASVTDPTGWSHVPPGYDEVSGQGYINWFSPMFEDGSTPFDLFPGEKLGGFSFVSAFASGPIAFTVNGLLDDRGTTVGPNPVPEPGTLLLLGTGITMGIARRRRSKLQA